MISKQNHCLLFTMLTVLAYNTINSAPITPRETYFLAGGLASAGIIAAGGTYYWAKSYFPAALAQKKLEIEETKRKEKEQKERDEQERIKAIENKKVQDAKHVTHLAHVYETEINLLKKNELQKEKGAALFTAIKSNCNDSKTPYTCYQNLLNRNLDSLYALTHLPTDRENEYRELISHLEQVKKAFNLYVADIQKVEQQEQQQIQKKEAAQKVEEELSSLKLAARRIKVNDASLSRKMNDKLDILISNIDIYQRTSALWVAEFRSVLNHFKETYKQQEHSNAELKKSHEEIKVMIRGLKGTIDKNNQLKAQVQPAPAPLPLYPNIGQQTPVVNPELYNQTYIPQHELNQSRQTAPATAPSLQ